MIVEIEPPHSNTLGPLAYNETKARTVKEAPAQKRESTSEDMDAIKTKGYEIVTRNVPEGSTLEEEFERLKILGRAKRTRKVITQESFHMSVNPSGEDRALSDEEAVRFISELMQRLGYGESPYRVYRHQDIAREHFHVVSTRIGQDGRKVKDSFERYQMHAILKDLSQKYGFSVEETHQDRMERGARAKADRTRAEERRREKAAGKKEKRKCAEGYVPAFSRQSGEPVSDQIRAAHDAVMQWSFSTFDQYRMLMRARYSVDVEYLEDNPDHPEETLLYSGLDDGVTRVTPGLSHSELGIDMEEITGKCGQERMSAKKAQRARVDRVMRESIEAAASYADLHAEMKKRGVAMCVSWTRDGEAFGVTYFDYATKCVFKGSETSSDLLWLKENCAQRGFEIIQGKREKPVRSRRDIRSARQEPSPVTERQLPVTAQRTPSRGTAPFPTSAPAVAGSGEVGTDGVSGKKDEDEIMEEIRLGLR